jgi:hypothetical protein
LAVLVAVIGLWFGLGFHGVEGAIGRSIGFMKCRSLLSRPRRSNYRKTCKRGIEASHKLCAMTGLEYDYARIKTYFRCYTLNFNCSLF